ncbi:hypothetical protein BH11BAC4_BH11BAC4_09510 [soil metagenome]
MKSNIIFLVVFLIAAFLIYKWKNPTANFNADKKEGIQFYRGTWQTAIEKAAKENKLIFLDIYASWCGPCKRLKNNVFSDTKVGGYFNATFINISLDGEKAEGEMLADRYKVSGYPTLLFLNKHGDVVSQVSGYYDADELIKLGEEAVKQGL